MDIGLNELVILAQFSGSYFGRPQSFKPADLGHRAALMVPQPSFDATIATENIKSLVQRRLLREERDKTVTLTYEGWTAVINALPVLERLRAACAMVRT